MSKRVSFKMYGEDAKACLDFANAVGQPLDKIAKVALVRYINDTLQKAEQMAEAQAKLRTNESEKTS